MSWIAGISRCHPSRAFRTFKAHLAPGRRPQHVVARRIENAVDQRGQATPTACGDSRSRWAIQERGLGFRKASRCSAKSDTLGARVIILPLSREAALSAPAESRACVHVHAGHLSIVPSDCDRIPACFGDNATISGIASPINAGALLEFLRFVDCHYCFSGASVSLSEAVKRQLRSRQNADRQVRVLRRCKPPRAQTKVAGSSLSPIFAGRELTW